MIKLEFASTIKLVLGVLLAAIFSVLVIQHYSLQEQLGEAQGRVALLEQQNALYEATEAVNREVLADYAIAVDQLQYKLQEKESKVNVIVKENPEWASSPLPDGIADLLCNQGEGSASTAATGASTGLCSVR